MEPWQVVDLGCLLRQLHRRLVLHHPLAHGGCVRVAYWDDLGIRIVTALSLCALLALGIVRIVLVGVVPDDLAQELQLLLHRVVDASLHRRHDLQLPLKQGQGRAHGRLRTHVRDIHVCGTGKPPSLIDDLIQQLQQGAAWLFVRQSHYVVAHCPAGDIHIPELTWGDGRVIALDSQPASLQSTRQVRQSTGVHKLTDQRRSRLGSTTDQVDQTKAVAAKTRDVLVVNEVLALLLSLVILQPIAANRQDFRRIFQDRDHIRERNAGVFTVLVHILIALQVDLNVHFQQQIPLIEARREPSFFVFPGLDVVDVFRRVAKLNIPVETSVLELQDLVFRLPHTVRETFCGEDFRRSIGQNDVFSRHKHRNLTLHVRVVVHLLERTAANGQVPQHPLMLWPVFNHHLSQLVVHVFLHTNSRCVLLRSAFSNDVGLDRTRRRE